MIFFRITILLIISSVKLSGQDEQKIYPIDSVLNLCSEKDGTTVGLIGCYYQANLAWQIEMDKYYTQLIGIGDSNNEIESLKQSQELWLKFRTAELSYQKKAFDSDGTMWPIIRAYLAMNIVKSRAIQLEEYYEILTQH